MNTASIIILTLLGAYVVGALIFGIMLRAETTRMEEKFGLVETLATIGWLPFALWYFFDYVRSRYRNRTVA